ncbi:dihydrolipoamide acetyltransferase family protein [Halobacteriales archaeon Cl-PHB]
MFEYELPDVGEGVAEGEIVAWHVEPGDEISEDEVLAEVETDKAVVDLPAPTDGVIRELHAEVGDMVPVGSVVVTIDVEGEVPEEAVEGDTATEEAATDGTEAGAAEAEAAEPADAETEAAEADVSADGQRVFAPPNVRRLARELGVNVGQVGGSGPGGRVTEMDVREAAGAGGSDDETVEEAIDEVADEPEVGGESGPDSASSGAGQAESVPAVESDESADRDRTLAAPATRKTAQEAGVDLDAVPTEKTRDGKAFVEPEDVQAYAEAQQAAQRADAAAVSAGAGGADAAGRGPQPTEGQRETREPYTGVRRTIGKKMEESAYTAPHVTHHDTAVVDSLVEARESLKPRAEEQGIRLTYMPFVLKAVAAGLKEYPALNTSLDEENEEVVYKHYYDVGVATATDAGLMVPVVENVDGKSLLQLASDINEVTQKARNRSISREELTGSTFSVTNFGAIGGEYATPIINYPETGILGLGALDQRPVVEDGEVVARHTLPLSLSIDHRVIDGAEAARFANTVIEYLETPSLLLLE